MFKPPVLTIFEYTGYMFVLLCYNTQRKYYDPNIQCSKTTLIRIIILLQIVPNKFFESQSIRTLAAKAERGVHVLQHVVHLGVVDPTPNR